MLTLYGFYFDRLRLLRTAANLKKAEVAAHIGMDQQTVINHEKGRFPPSLETIEKYAKLYGVDVIYFYLDNTSVRVNKPSSGGKK